MSEKPSYFKLGAFVIVTTAIALAAVAALGAGAFLKSTIKAETYMEESVQGLDVGAPVKHRGVTVGSVRRIAFLGEEYDLPSKSDGTINRLAVFVLVEMELDVDRRGQDRTVQTFSAAVRGGMHARLASTGIVGNVFVDLYFPTDTPPPPPAISWTPRSLYIPSTKSFVAEFTATATRIAKQLEDAKLDQIAAGIDKLVTSVTAKVDQVDIVQVQQDAVALVSELRDSNKRLREILDAPAIAATLTNIESTTASLSRITGGGETDIAAFLKDLPQVSARLKASAEEIENILKDEKTRQIIDDLARTSAAAPDAAAEVRRLAHRVSVLLASQESDIEDIVHNLRAATANLERLSSEAAQNPSRVIFGEPPPASTRSPRKEQDK